MVLGKGYEDRFLSEQEAAELIEEAVSGLDLINKKRMGS